jgi:oligoendopeptidase F
MPTRAKTKVGSWELGDLEKSYKEGFEKFLRSIEKQVRYVEAKNQILANTISATDFKNLLLSVENISERMSIAAGYSHLLYATDTSSNEGAALMTKMDALSSNLSNRLLFFDMWFKKQVNEDDARRLIDSVPEVYREFLKHKRLLSKYTLTEPEEKIINTLEVTGTNALIKIYDRFSNGLEFIVTIKKNKTLTKKKFFNKEKLVSMIRSSKHEEREAAYRSLLQVYKKNSGILSEIYLNRVIQWRDEFMNMRGFDSAISVRNMFNNIEDSTIQTLLDACKRNASIFHSYFQEKAKFLGMRKLHRYHLYAPLLSNAAYQKKITYNQAKSLVLKTFKDFTPTFREFAQRLFLDKHLDYEIRKNKQSGAFCSTISPKITPYVLLNFDGTRRDVSTMSHELGHAIHSICASSNPFFVAHAPLPLAETASVFAEMLLNDSLSSGLEPEEHKTFLAQQIDDFYATIMRQAYFTIFEINAHKAISEANIPAEGIAQIYLNNLKQQFGHSVHVTADFSWEWLFIPHFYHTPFYCYAYSFGNLLALSLYSQYKKEGKGFIPKYLGILSAGGSQKPETLLKGAGIDITAEGFWQQGFDLVSERIQSIKKMN